MSDSVRLEQLRNIGHQRIIGVGVSQEGTDTEQDLANGQCWTPLVLENVQTDTSVRVDVAMVNACGKVNLGRLERIVGRKVNVQKEDTARIGRVLRSHNCRLPVEHIITNGSRRAI